MKVVGLASRLWAVLRYGFAFRFLCVTFIFLALYAAAINWYSNRTVWETVRAEQSKPVMRIRNGLLAIYQSGGRQILVNYIKERTAPDRAKDSVMLLTAPDGRILAGNLARWPGNLKGSEKFSHGMIQLTTAPRPIYMGLSTADLPDGSRLLVGVPILSETRVADLHRQTFRTALLYGIVFAVGIWLALCLIGATYLRSAWRVLEGMKSGRFSGRIKLSGANDRFDRFFSSVNRTLDQIEPMVQEIEVVTTGLAHDMRSPLGRLRLSIERAAEQSKDPHTTDALQATLQDVDRLLDMLSKTMEIAQANSTATRQRFEQCNLAEILQSMAEMYGPLAEEKGFEVVVAAEPVEILLHRHLFEKALSNMVENALNYADGGSHIEISAKRVDDMVEVSVSDDGFGIPEHRFEDALRRYGRLDPARNLMGTGLGLSIVDAVARMHGGTVALSSNRPGLCVTMYLPAPRPS